MIKILTARMARAKLIRGLGEKRIIASLISENAMENWVKTRAILRISDIV